jgi:hypothetical protein
MASIVEICNMALASIRAKSINSLTEASIEAQQCKLHYDIARQFILQDTPWNFAKKSAALQLMTVEPQEWLYAYQYPIDCLRVQSVIADYGLKNPAEFYNEHYREDYVIPDTEMKFEIVSGGDGKMIVTDQQDAYAIYTKNVKDPTLFDPQFVKALTHYLASMIAVPVMGGDIGRTMRGDELELYKMTISSAVASNMNESRRPAPRYSRLIDVRK